MADPLTPDPALTAQVAAQTYVSLTTFRRSGEGVATPVWVVGLADGRVGITTTWGSGKTKRLAHTPRVTLRPCDVRGRVEPDAPTWEGTAEVVRSGALLEEVQGRVRRVYGVRAALFRAIAWVSRRRGGSGIGDAAVIVRLGAPGG